MSTSPAGLTFLLALDDPPLALKLLLRASDGSKTRNCSVSLLTAASFSLRGVCGVPGEACAPPPWSKRPRALTYELVECMFVGVDNETAK